MDRADACAVGRIGPDGAWVGFARRMDGGHAVAIGLADGVRTRKADTDLLLCLAVAYFAEGLEEPPEDLAATHADVADVVRHLAAAETDAARRERLEAAVDAIDDGLGQDVVIARLTATIRGPASGDPVGHAREVVLQRLAEGA